MTNLSTQTQAIIDAADEVFSHGGTIRESFAAALRVLADNIAIVTGKQIGRAHV